MSPVWLPVTAPVGVNVSTSWPAAKLVVTWTVAPWIWVESLSVTVIAGATAIGGSFSANATAPVAGASTGALLTPATVRLRVPLPVPPWASVAAKVIWRGSVEGALLVFWNVTERSAAA